MYFILQVYIEVDSEKDAEDIAHDIHEILGNNGITNSINVINDTNDEEEDLLNKRRIWKTIRI